MPDQRLETARLQLPRITAATLAILALATWGLSLQRVLLLHGLQRCRWRGDREA